MAIKFPTETTDATLQSTDRVMIDDGTNLKDVPASDFLNADNHTDGTTNKLYTATEKTKLGNIEANAKDDQTGTEIKAAYENEANTNVFTDTEKSKLISIEENATEDQSDSEIVTAINTELGNTNWQTQLPKTTQEEIEDYVAAMFQAGSHTNITVSYNDAAGSISLTGSAGGGGGSSLTQEQVEDFVGGVLTSGTGITVTYNDAGNSILVSLSGESFTTAFKNKLDTIAENATANDTDANLKSRVNHTGTQTASTISNFQATVSGNSAVTANTVKVGITPTQASNITTNNAKNTYPSADSSKLAGIEANAEVNTVDSVNGDTGVIVLDADNISDTSTTNKYTTAGDISKLGGIEEDAEVNTINSDNAGIAGANQVTNVVSMTTAEYGAITPNSSTLYIITDA